MLNKINIEDLQIGVIFSAPLYFPDGKNIFLQANTAISSKDLEVLNKWNFKYVLSNGIKTNEIDNDYTRPQNMDSNETISKSFDLKLIMKQTDSYKHYLNSIKKLNILFEIIKNKEVINENPIVDIMKNLKQIIDNNSDLTVGFILNLDLNEYQLAKSSIDTAILSYIIAKNLNLDENKFEEIFIASILHDIGMLRINNEILQKQEKLTNSEIKTIQTHTNYGLKYAVSELLYTENIGKIILQHHERWDGKGYPNNLFEDEINIGARIIAVCDSFIAMTTPKPYREALSGYDAIKSLLKDNAKQFDPAIVKILIQSVGIYPIGSIVMLNNTSICRVIQSSNETLLRPTIKVLIDPQGQYISDEEEIIKLSTQKNLFIIKSIDTNNYAYIN